MRTGLKSIFILLAGLSMQAAVAVRPLQGKMINEVNPLVLRYSAPGDAWTDGVAVGNGRLGAMVFGGIEKDRLQLNDITVWSGGPSPDADRIDAYKSLPKIRALLKDGKYAEATSLVGKTMTSKAEYFPSYQNPG